MKTRSFYALAALAVFSLEVIIALWVHDTLIRPYIGDSLAVVLVNLALRVVTPLPVLPSVLVSFAIAAILEIGQFFHVLDVLGLNGNRMARIILGTGFDPKDFVAYALGAACALAAESARKQRLI